MDHLRCVVERITYQNPQNGYSVIKCRVKGYSDLVTVVGSMPDVHVGKEGNFFLIHPEGTRTRDGKLGAFKDGAAKIAIETGLTIIPVAIEGGYEIWPYDRKLPETRDKDTWPAIRRKLQLYSYLPMMYTLHLRRT